MNSTQTIPADDGPGNAPARPRGLYVFAVVALAVFLLGLVVWPGRAGQFMAEAVVTFDLPRDQASNALEPVIAELTTPANAERLLYPAGSPNTPGEQRELTNPSRTANTQAAHCVPMASASLQPGESGVTHRAVIRTLGVAQAETVALADHLARDFIRRYGQWHAEHEGISAEVKPSEQTRQAWEAARTARQDIQSLVEDHFAACQSQAEAAATNLRKPATSDRTPAETSVPAERELEQALKELNLVQSQRAEMLTRLTHEHPQVRNLDNYLATLDARVAELRRVVEQSHTSPATAPKFADDDIPAGSPYSPETLAETQDRFRQLMDEELHALRSYQLAMWGEVHTARASRLSTEPSATVSQPAIVIQRVKDSSTVARLVTLGGIALVAAAFCCFWLSRAVASTALDSPGRLSQWLRLPVVGVLASPGALPRWRPVVRSDRGPRFVLKVCELTLFALAAMLLVSSASGTAGLDFLADPIGTFLSSLSHLSA